MVEADVPRNIFEFSPLDLLKQLSWKGFCEKSKASFKKGNHEKCVFWNIKTIF